MQLTPPQPPQDDDVEALRIGLTGYNVSQAGPQLYETSARADRQLYQG